MSVDLTNRSNMAFTCTLYHEKYCAAGGPCECKEKSVRRSDHNPSTGMVRHYTEKALEPKSLRIAPGETVRNLHDAILKVPQVGNWLRQNKLKSVQTAGPSRRRRRKLSPSSEEQPSESRSSGKSTTTMNEGSDD